MSTKRYHHGSLRSALIEAGIALVNHEGADKLSLRKVAAQCGVSPAAPYSHFQSKEDLLQGMRDYVLKQFMECLEGSIEHGAGNDPEVLIRMGKSYVLFFVENPQYFSFLFSQLCMDVNLSLRDDGKASFPPYELLKQRAVPVLQALNIPDDKYEDAIISMWATVHGLAAIATMRNVRYTQDWETKIEDVIWNRRLGAYEQNR